jgi:hypothetical protein
LYELDATTATVSAIKKRKKRGGVNISSKSFYVATTKNSNNVWIAERMIINSGKLFVILLWIDAHLLSLEGHSLKMADTCMRVHV